MRKRILCLALVLVTACLAGCSEEVVVSPELKEPVGVQSDMAAAYIGEIYNIAYYDASVIPYIEGLYFEVDGVVSSVNVYPGMKVEEGDVLIEMNQEALQDQVDARRDELEYLEQDYAYTDALAQMDIDMLDIELRQMKANGADETQIALKELDIRQKQANLRHTQQLREPELEDKRKALAELENDLVENCLTAPFTGTIIYGDILREGSSIKAFDNVLYLADDTRLQLMGEYVSDYAFSGADRIYAQIGAEEYEIERVPLDQEEYISKVLSGGTLNSYYELVGSEEELAQVEAGQYAAVFVRSNYIGDALLVPSGAVLKDATGRYVYVNEDGQRVRRMVKVGMTTDGLAQITEGLEEGEVVYVKD